MIKLRCKKPLAKDSNDYLFPYGTSICNSRNLRFVNKILKLFKGNNINVLDLGCSGGGFVRDCINKGCLAIGLEGSDFSKRFKRQEWATIPDFLFTCDITEDFELLVNKERIKFDLITSWEVLEHIKTENVMNVIRNIKNNLKENGLFICSISNCSEIKNGVELHETQKPFEWWIKQFEKQGFYLRKELYRYFRGQYVNGSKRERFSNFHLILSLENRELGFPKLSFQDKFLDFWKGCWLQKRIKYFVTGQ